MEIRSSYVPNTWQSKAHASPARHKCAVGGLGSGKTLWGIEELKQLALEHPGSRWVIGRKLLPSLKDSIWRDLLQILPKEIVRSYNIASMTIVLTNGSEFWGRPLYDPELFKSYQISGFLIEEANEVDKDIYDRLKDRMRQKLPDGSRPRYTSIILLNPTDEEHWIPQLFMSPPKNHEIFYSSTYDNLENLPQDYTEELKSIYSDEVLVRLLYGRFGKVHKGRPVYGIFNSELHVRPVAYDPKLPLIRGWDFGYNHPGCVWLQMENKQVRVLAEKLGKRIYLNDFVNKEVLPLQDELFGRNMPIPTIDFCDPRGSDLSDKGKTSVQILNDNRIFPVYRRTTIDEGIKATLEYMGTKDLKTGLPNYLVHPRCKNLIEGDKGGYHRLDGEEMPEKDGTYDHLQDCRRYALIFLKMRLKARDMTEAQSEIKVHITRSGRRFEYRGN